MRYVLAFTPRARDDIEHAYRHYEGERPGLGAEFRDELWHILDLLVLTPELGPVAHRDLRWVVPRRFPYMIYYRLQADVIEVRACLHHRQDRPRHLRRA